MPKGFLKKTVLMRVSIQNAFIYLTTLRMLKALTILSAVINKIHLHLKKGL